MKTSEFKANLCTLNEIFVINEKFSILLTNKVSSYGSGKKTVYDGKVFKNVDGQKTEIVFTNASIDVIKNKFLECNEKMPRKNKLTFAAALETEKQRILDAIELLKGYQIADLNTEVTDEQILANNENLRQLKAEEEKAAAERQAKDGLKNLKDKLNTLTPEQLQQLLVLTANL